MYLSYRRKNFSNIAKVMERTKSLLLSQFEDGAQGRFTVLIPGICYYTFYTTNVA
jgi:hypothetical protein